MDIIAASYEKQLAAQADQIKQLQDEYKKLQSDNVNHIIRIKDLEDVLEKAKVANQDLNSAFIYLREENMKLQVPPKEAPPSDKDDDSLQEISKKYSDVVQQNVSWLAERDKLVQRIKYLEREDKRNNRDKSIMAKQIDRLIRTLEEERGMIIRDSKPTPETTKSGIITAQDVIEDKLVTYQSIEELRANNLKLLNLVENLAKELEQRETEFDNEDVARLKAIVAELTDKVQKLQEDRKKTQESLTNILQERDLFKILLSRATQAEHITPEFFQRIVDIAITNASSKSDDSGSSSQPSVAHISDLQSTIRKLELELFDSKTEQEALKKRLDDETKLKSELLETAHIKIAELEKSCETIKEQKRIIGQNFDEATRHLEEVRAKSQKYAFELDHLASAKAELEAKVEELEARMKTNKMSEQDRVLYLLEDIRSMCEVRDKLALVECKLSEMTRLRNLEYANHKKCKSDYFKLLNKKIPVLDTACQTEEVLIYLPGEVPINSPEIVQMYSPEVAPMDSPEVEPKNSPEVAPMDSHQVAPMDSPEIAPMDPPRIVPVDPLRIDPIDPPRIDPIDPPRVAPIDPPRVTPIDPPRVTPIDPPRVTPIDPPRITPIDSSQDSLTSPPRKGPINSPQKASTNLPRRIIIHSPQKAVVSSQQDAVGEVLGILLQRFNPEDAPESQNESGGGMRKKLKRWRS